MEEEYQGFLNSKKIKRQLLRVSLYLIAFEALRAQIEAYLQEFLEDDIHGSFRTEVLWRAPAKFTACLYWYKDKGVFTQEQVEEIQSVRKYRNVLAHEIANILLDEDTDVELTLFEKCCEYIQVISLFWLRVSVSRNPFLDFDCPNREKNFISPLIPILHHIRDIAENPGSKTPAI